MAEKHFKLKYGSIYLPLELKEENILHILEGQDLEPITDLEAAVNEILDNPLGTEPFNHIFASGQKVVIVVSDVTRLWVKTSLFLPFIIKRLNQLGITDDAITILVATGTHREESESELRAIVGTDIFQRIKVIDHICDQRENLVYVGTTSRGTEVEVNRFLLEADRVILTGGIVHHLMAGFGGGRKSIVPGVASKKTIAQNHLHALDPQAKKSNPLIGVGALRYNPLHEDMVEATALVNPDFLVNSIIDTKGQIVKLVGGHWLKAWEEGCRWCDDNFGITINEQADLVIASCGGYPKDMNLYQSTKSLFNAAKAVKPDGVMILITECREGAGADEFFGWSKFLLDDTIDQELRHNFTIPGYVFFAAVETAQKCKVILVSQISPEDVKPMGFHAVPDLQEALSIAYGILGPNPVTILMPYAGSTVPLFPPV
ncbi:nickel-dependent lactate racemase [Thermanaerosceptrum fracticalcis]|jgi:nickel-dependent lactate racemase|uniref:Nickel-dependent lactate racemase n=1 Tax=Thermanaerosceptrum fracticalcis TaxID=1712410 RepID=A0A7G6E1G0_THEFR|nr:nickel-dependent lactate racemase [Thermanaerosceptrum fracticalcis]QNB45914.1 nickel-dependent lactate racemase [Thermanaerosceptrum fracticalcis]